MDTMNIHPTANMLPQLSDAEYAELRDDIRTRGLLEPILRKDGHVVDGRHRLRACNELGIEPRFDEYEGADIVAEIFSRNILRRHLTADQRAMLVAKLRGEQLSKDAQARMKSGVANPALKSAQGRTAEKIASEAKVGRDKARSALHVLNNHKPLVADVIAGKRKLASVKKQKRKPRAKKTLTLQETVRRRYQRFLNRFAITHHRQAKVELVTCLLGQYDRKTNELIAPVSVTYADGSTGNIEKIISGEE
jgi:ParB-like chromosome segregation protein Spo0J